MDTTFQSNVNNGANLDVKGCAVQSDGKIVLVGLFTTFNGTTVNRIVRLNTDGTRDTSFTTGTGTGFNNDTMAVAIQSDQKILVGGSFTSFKGNSGRNRIIRLNTDGTEDTTFVTNVGTAVNANYIKAISIQSTGSILIAGKFTSFNGTAAGGLARLSSAGVFDTTFGTNIGAGVAGGGVTIHSMTVDSSDKVYIGGDFNSFAGNSNYLRLARLSSAGVVDSTLTKTSIGGGIDGYVYGIGVQSDGKVVVGGDFTTYNGTTGGNYVGRLNANGTLDTAFKTAIGTGANGVVETLAINTDGTILIGGEFTSINGSSVGYIAKLSSSGALDTTFRTNTGTGFNASVEAISIQSDGKIIVGGYFTSFNGTSTGLGITRLNADGTLDTTFNTNVGAGTNGSVTSIGILSTGEIIVGGDFSTFKGTNSYNVAKLATTGLPDATFASNISTNLNGMINALAITPGDRIVLGGDFTRYGLNNRKYLMRINLNGTFDSSFRFFLWRRCG